MQILILSYKSYTRMYNKLYELIYVHIETLRLKIRSFICSLNLLIFLNLSIFIYIKFKRSYIYSYI